MRCAHGSRGLRSISCRGITLVDALAAVAVIATLLALTWPAFAGKRAEEASASAAAEGQEQAALSGGVYFACCLLFGTCTLVPPQDCIGGTVVTSSTTCSPNPCPVPCCDATTGACTLVAAASCTGTVTTAPGCMPSPCPTACCDMTTGVCSVLPPSACFGISQPGVCSTALCPSGACCGPFGGFCTITGLNGCFGGIAGFFPNVTCSPNPCPVPCCDATTGACTLVAAASCTGTVNMAPACMPSPCPTACCDMKLGVCSLLPPSSCIGVSQPGPCSPALCPSGACCGPFGGICTITGLDGCFGGIGNFFPNVACSPNPCPVPCCDAATGACTLVAAASCTGTVTNAPGCMPSPCPTACCNMTLGVCSLLPPGACVGASLPGPCSPALCPRGACCGPILGFCTITGLDGCLGGIGNFFPNVTCSPSPCPVPCCDAATGFCTLVAAASCTGTVTNAPGGCMPSPCPVACCDPATGLCSILPASGCSSGVTPPGAICTPNPCPAACCDPMTGACTIIAQGLCTGTIKIGICAPSPCPPIARCRDLTLDASKTCVALTVLPGDINNGSSHAPKSTCAILSLSLDSSGPFPVGTTTVTLTVTDCNGSSTCTAKVKVLGQDCNLDGIPDVCQCFWQNSPGPAGPFSTDGQLSSIAGTQTGGSRVADDFFVCEGQVAHVYGFRGRMLTTSLPGLHKARLDFFEDCNGVPANTPFASYFNPIVESEVPGPNGLTLVGYFFDFCDKCLFLDGGRAGGKTYWVSLVGLPSGQPLDESFWAAAPRGLAVMGSVPVKSMGPSSAIPITYESVAFGPWAQVSECCIGCVNMDYSLFGETCVCTFDNGAPRTDRVDGELSGSVNQLTYRAYDDFVVPECNEQPICLLEAYIWTNCPNPRPFLEIYQNDCDKPGVRVEGTPCDRTLVGGLPEPTAVSTGITRTLNGKVYTLYLVTTRCGPKFSLPGGGYWLSAGATDPSGLNTQTYFAGKADDCIDPALCKKIRFNPALDRKVKPVLDPLFTSTQRDLAFRLAYAPVPVRMEPPPENGPPPPPAASICRPDINKDGKLTVQDLFDYLGAFFAGCR